MQTVHPLMPLKTSKNMRESRENRWLTNTGTDLRPFGGTVPSRGGSSRDSESEEGMRPGRPGGIVETGRAQQLSLPQRAIETFLVSSANPTAPTTTSLPIT